MAISMTKNFWNTTADQYNAIAKIVFTSPNIDSPAIAGTRSHILPGGEFIATWYEAVDYLHRIKWTQDPPDKQATYFAKLNMNQDISFNFNIDDSVTVISNYPVNFSAGQIVSYNTDEYGVVETAISGSITTFGGQLLGLIKENVKHGGCIYAEGVYIYRAVPQTNKIYRYDILQNIWDEYLQAPDTFGDYTSIIKVETKIYCIKGSSDRVFWEYDLVSFIWTSLCNLPINIDNYTFINSFGDSNIVYLLKSGTSIIYEYNVIDNLWSTSTTINLSGYDSTVYGPSFWKYLNKYYMWAATLDGVDVGIKYIEVDPSTGTATDKGEYKCLSTLSGVDVSSFISLGDYATCSGMYGTGISTFSHFNIDGADNEFLYSFHNTTKSGIDIISTNSYGSLACTYSTDTALFPAMADVNPDIASITTTGSGYYFIDNKSDFVDTYLNLCDLTPSGITTDCDTSYSYLSGESSDTLFTNLTCLSNDIYITEGTYSNSLWKYNISTEEWDVYSSIALKDSGTDRNFTIKEHSYILNDGTDLFLLKGSGFNSFYKYTVTSGIWEQLEDTPGILSEYNQGVYVSSNNSIYVIQGKDSSSLWKYDISGNSWTIKQGAPSSFTNNCGFQYPIWGGDFIYASRGRGYGHFWKYIISNDEWEPLTGILLYGNLITGLTSRGTLDSNGKIYSIDGVNVSEYRVDTNVWIRVSGYLSYNDLDKNFISNSTGSDLYVAGDSGLRRYEIDNLATISEQTQYDITFSNVVGTSVVSITDYFSTWEDNLSNDSVWAHAKNTIIFEATNGEAYDCKLTAWDDDTHTTTSNQILNGSHYRATCAVYKAVGGTKTEPLSGNHNDILVHPVGVDKVLKGNDSYYGTFTFIHIANGGITGQEHGNYLIFLPRLAGMDDTFGAGNYDFITTFHYSYT